MDNMDHDMLEKDNNLEDPLSLFDYENHRVLNYEEISKFAIEHPGYPVEDEPEEEIVQPAKSALFEEELPHVSASNKSLLLKTNIVNNEKVYQNQMTSIKSTCNDASNSDKNFAGRNLKKYTAKSCDKTLIAGCVVSNIAENVKKSSKLCDSESLKNSVKRKASQNVLQSSTPPKINLNTLNFDDNNFLSYPKEGKDVRTSALVPNSEKTTKHLLIKAKENNDAIIFKELIVGRDNDLSMEIEKQRVNNNRIDQNSVPNYTVLPKVAAISKSRRNTICTSCPYTSVFNMCDKNVYKHNKIIPHYHKLSRNHMSTSHRSKANGNHVVNGLAEVVIKNVRSESLTPLTTDLENNNCENINAIQANAEGTQILHQQTISFIPVLLNKNSMPTKNSKACSTNKAVQLKTISSYDQGIQENNNILVTKIGKNDDKINKYAVPRNIIPVLMSGNPVEHNLNNIQNNVPNRSIQGLITNNCNLQHSPQPRLHYQHFPFQNFNYIGDINPYTSINNSANLPCNVNRSVAGANRYNSKILMKPPVRNSTPLNVINNLPQLQQFERTSDKRYTNTQNQNFQTNATSVNKEICSADKCFDSSQKTVKSVNSKVQKLGISDRPNKLSQRKFRTQSCDYTGKHPEIVKVLESPVTSMPLYNIHKVSGMNNSLTNQSNEDINNIGPKTEYSPPILPILSYEDILNIISRNKFYGFHKPHLL